MQPDPIGYGDGMNMYAYTGNNPINYSDPSGLKTLKCKFWIDPETGEVVAYDCKETEEKATHKLNSDWTVSTIPNDDYVTGNREFNSGDDDDRIDEIVVIGRKGCTGDCLVAWAWDNDLFNFDKDESFFKLEGEKLTISPADSKRRCGNADAYGKSPSYFDGADGGGHTHTKGYSPNVGPDDGLFAMRYPNMSIYMVSTSGAYRINYSPGGTFSIETIAGRQRMSNREQKRLIKKWSKYGGKSSKGGVTKRPNCRKIY